MTPRTAVHYGLLLPLWVLFCWGWYKMLTGWPRADLIASLRLLALFASFCGIAVTLWIRHNLGIFRRKGPRAGVTQARADFSTDALGREVERGSPDAWQMQSVCVELRGDVKLYRGRETSREERRLEPTAASV